MSAISKIHHHLLVRACVNAPVSNVDRARDWVTELTKIIGMKLLHPVIAAYCDDLGNRGVTAAAIISTSHISLHIWDERTPPVADLDIYSCCPFNLEDVWGHFESLRPISIDYKLLDRETGFLTLATNNR